MVALFVKPLYFILNHSTMCACLIMSVSVMVWCLLALCNCIRDPNNNSLLHKFLLLYSWILLSLLPFLKSGRYDN